jgi:hypothetical protein
MPNAPLDAETEAELRRLALRYAEAMDRRSPELLLPAFAADGVLEVFWPADHVNPASRIEGHDRLAAIPPSLDRWPSTLHDVRASEYAPVDATTAEGSVDCVAHHFSQGATGTEDRVMRIRYADDYRLVDGRWVIARRQVRVFEDEVRPVGSDAIDG